MSEIDDKKLGLIHNHDRHRNERETQIKPYRAQITANLETDFEGDSIWIESDRFFFDISISEEFTQKFFKQIEKMLFDDVYKSLRIYESKYYVLETKEADLLLGFNPLEDLCEFISEEFPPEESGKFYFELESDYRALERIRADVERLGSIIDQRLSNADVELGDDD